jgi:hypothetical protein
LWYIITPPHYWSHCHQDDSNGSDSDVVDSATSHLATDLPILVSPGHGSVVHQASPMRVNTKITQDSIQETPSYEDLDVIKEAEDEGIDVFANNKDYTDTYSTRRSGYSAISSDNLALDSNVSLFELLGG